MADPGRVLNRAAQELPRAAYDFVVVGGGLLGVVCAWFLREFAPKNSVLLVEAGGIPSEEGATHVSPALHGNFYSVPEDQARARWLTALLKNLENNERRRISVTPSLFHRIGFLRPADDTGNSPIAPTSFAAWRSGQSEAVRHNVESFFGFADDTSVRFDPAGGYGSAEALTLRLGHATVGAGLDLLLNTRATFAAPDCLLLDRLEVNNQMQVETVRQTRVRARTVVVACGADCARLIADGLGEAPPFGSRCYLQYPRFENDRELRRDARGIAELPVVAAHGFAVRPHADGVMLVPTEPLLPDPAGYVPAGGQFFGVSVGLRRELLDRLILTLDVLPALSRPSLNLGKTPGNLRGAWEVITPSGRPEFWRAPGTDVWALASGGNHGFSLGIAAACELAHQLSATAAPLPWHAELAGSKSRE